jgi:hypothetical protein
MCTRPSRSTSPDSYRFGVNPRYAPGITGSREAFPVVDHGQEGKRHDRTNPPTRS